MKTLIVYDSEYGNTKQIAEAIAVVLRQHGSLSTEHVDMYQHDDLQGIDLLIVGCPTQGWHATAPIQTFLASLQPHVVERFQIACFDTRFNMPRWLTGSAAGQMAAIGKELGFKLLVAPESFFVQGREGPLGQGELHRAAVWGWALVQAYESSIAPAGVE